ncbi:YfgM family protein [Crenobacter cavernae]|uniref:Ancillary SecYEG translocon subunit n=1 Tax=Crenobacter cavernae TaxID=2290923 RepID=A0A345Y730_9NEIS|nr:tetratricopeptide repeat protein [Crenobacter cavernae]AXK39732.1 hypothetical protein DWG20_09890 [Crenobacter cavernae]
MAFDLQEQEQLDALKAFWSRWGKWIAGAVAGLALAYAGYQGWQYYEKQQSSAAAAVFSQVEASLAKGDLAAVKGVQAKLAEAYPGSAYASRAAFLAARAAFDKGDLAYAKQQLTWVTQHSDEAALKALAHLRLAAVQLDEKRFDAAIAELNQEHPTSFDALFLDLKGDVYVARGDAKSARDAYKAALAKLAGESPNRQFIQTKLDALGG